MRGHVKVQIPEGGVAKTINELKENDFFGEMSLLTGQPRSANVVAVEETEVLQIRKGALKLIFDGNPELVDAICEIVEERQELLKRPETGPLDRAEAEQKGVMLSIRRFFGLG